MSVTDLEAMIQGAINSFESERSYYWESEDRAPYLELADAIARQMVAASEDLVKPEGQPEIPLDWHHYRFLAGIEGFRETVFEAVQIKVAWELCTDSDGKADRCLELAQEVLADQPGPEVLKFIRRLTRCYVAGFFPECVILCRGVLENAVKEKFKRHSIPLPATAEGESSMKTILLAAHTLGWLSTQAHTDAWIVWRRGSKALHEDLDATKDTQGTVQMTVSVLRELYNAA